MGWQISIQPLSLDVEREVLADWLASDRWPYHSEPQLSREAVLAWIDRGGFTGSDCQTFWIMADTDRRVGLIRLFDLDDIEDGAPMFDLRVKSDERGRGIGKYAVQWLTTYLFETWPELCRIEGTTRGDNQAMQQVFEYCHYVKEGHYRKAWVSADGTRLDAIHYGILREDWMTQKTTPVDW